jgi:molecular chaperone GrpE (heat shock protein)
VIELDVDKIHVICEALSEAAEHEAQNPHPGPTDPDLLLDAMEKIEELLAQLISLRKTLVEANAELQNLRSAGGIY